LDTRTRLHDFVSRRVPTKLRVVFIAWRDTSHPQAGGSEVVVDRLALGLHERGHDVLLLAGAPTTAHPYAAKPIGGRFGQYARAPFEFARHAHHADVVVDVENGIPYFAPMWQRAPVVCLVHHVHTEQWAMQFPRPLAAVGRWLESTAMPRAYQRADFVSVSPSTTEGLVGLGVERERITTIEMGCEPVPVTGARSPTPRFLVLGRLVPHKRVDRALALWPRVRAGTGGELVVVGDGPETGRLRAMAGSGVTFTGQVATEEKGRELGAAWALIHPAHHEGWGTVVMEAAGAGVPTVAYDVPGVRDSVVDGATGILARDDDAFVEAWIRMGTDDAFRDQLSRAARARAAAYTWPNAVDAFESVISAAAARRERGISRSARRSVG
jgi:glycosyltransferase involved in cell wall biosynthesis